MRKLLLLTAAATCGLFLFYRVVKSHKPPLMAEAVFVNKEENEDKEDGIREAMEMEFEATKDVSLGYVPKNRLTVAVNNLIKERRRGVSRLTKANAFTWTERGPNTDVTGPSNGNTRPGNGATSGRVRSIWVDLADATNKTVWIGGVDGGIWKTTDITSPTPNWSPVNDFFSNLAIGSICQNPANNNEMYFGTGEKAQTSQFIVQGGGVWKSTDHGLNWNLLPSTTTFFNVSKVLCDASGNVYVSAVPSLFGLGSTGGIFRSSDGGNTWTNITPTGLSSKLTEMELSATGRLHIVCGYSSVSSAPDPAPGYRYTDTPDTVSSLGWSSGTGFPSPQYNCELTVSGNTLYALNSNSSFQTTRVYKSTDGGATWNTCTTSPPTGGSSHTTLSSGQAWYNMEAIADPANGNNVIVGGLNTYRSTNGGDTWTQSSIWIGTTGQFIHADQHTGTWNGNQVLIGCDGGVFYSADGGLTWSDRNTGLRLKQFYSVAIHPTTTNYFLGGAQDNGTHQLTNAGLGGSIEVTGGDGAFTHIDQDEPQYQFGSYVYNNYRRSSDGGASWDYIDYTSVQGQFINPTDYDDGNNKMYGGGAVGQYIRWEDPQTGTTFTPVSVTALGSDTVRSVTVSPYTSNRVFFGTRKGRVVKVDNANTNAPADVNIAVAGMPTTTVSSIALGTDDNNIIATYSNYGTTAHVWMTTTGGGSWTDITGNLPDIPVRWALFYPDDNTKAILATEMGVYETNLINGSSTVWTADPNFPTVLTAMLQYRRSDGTLAAATHGRGLWTTIIPQTIPSVRFSSAYRTVAEGVSGTSGCRGYKDYTVDLMIDAPPSGDAGITVNATGGSTATRGVDYDFTTNGNLASPSSTFIFANGVKSSKTITIRVYDDANVEGTKSFTLNYSISGTTNAIAAPNFQTYTITLTDNDVAPLPGVSALYTIGTVSFSLGNASAGQPFDAKLRQKKTQMLYLAGELTAQGITAGNINSFALFVGSKNSIRPFQNLQIKMGLTSTSYLWNNNIGSTNYVPLTPVKSIASYSTIAGWNTFILDVPFAWNGTSNVVIEICYDNTTTSSSDFADVVYGYSDGSVSSIGNMVWVDNQACDIDFDSFTYYFNGVKPEIQFQVNSGNPVESTLNASRTQYVGDNNTYYFYNASNGDILNSISNASADLGCVSSSILETGNTWQSFLTGQRSGKVYTVTPSSNSNATYTVSLYFSAAELAGKTPASLKIAKTTAATMAGANTSNTLLGTTTVTPFGSGSIFTASFTGFSNFFLADAGVILPVTLLKFEGHLKNEMTVLDWSTSSEQNSKSFDLEKSTDGINYNQIGTVRAAGNSDSRRDYTFTDGRLSPANYYRLRMNDNNGRNQLSQVVLIRYDRAKQKVWVVNNPFGNYLDLQIGKAGSQLRLQLINTNGSVVAQKIITAASGQIRWDLPGHLSKGTYVLKAVMDGESFSSKLIKQ